MKRKETRGHGTAVYLETIGLILVFLAVLLLLVRVFAAARTDSTEARRLNNSVTLCANAAELCAASDSPEGFAELMLSAGENCTLDANTVTARYNDELSPDADGAYTVVTQWSEDNGLWRCGITALYEGQEVYTLETAVYPGEEGAQ